LSNSGISFDVGKPGLAAGFNGEAQIEFPAFQADRFSLAFWMRSGAMGEMTVLEGGPGLDIGVEDSHPQPDAKRGSPLYVEYRGRRWHSSEIVFGEEWHHLVLNFEGAQPRLLLDAKPVEMTEVGPVTARAAGPLAIGDPHREKPLKGGLADLRIYDRSLSPAEAETFAIHDPVRFILLQSEGKRSKDQNQRLLDYFLTYDAEPEFRRAYHELNSLKRRLSHLKDEIASVQVICPRWRGRATPSCSRAATTAITGRRSRRAYPHCCRLFPRMLR
jgi:hypothetical protein